MPLDQVANIAEIVGVVLVVVTLVFLSLQIRQNTTALRSTTIHAVMQSEMEFAAILLRDTEIWDKVLSGAPLSEGVEMRKGIMLLNVFMIDTETRYHQFTSGFLDAQAWTGRLSTMSDVVRLPIFERWRHSLGGLSHAADFLELLDDLLLEDRDEQQ